MALFRIVGLFLVLEIAHLSADRHLGVTEALVDVEVSASSSGWIKKISVEEGQKIKKDGLLLNLDSVHETLSVKLKKESLDYRANLETLESNLKILKTIVKDNEVLMKEGNVSREEVSNLKYRLNTLQGEFEGLQFKKKLEKLELKAAEHELSLRSLRSPVNGVVIDVKKSRGEWVKVGEVVFRIVDPSRCALEANVPESEARGVKHGQKVKVAIDGPKGEVVKEATVKFCSPVADPASGLVKIKVSFDNQDALVRPGASAHLVIDSK